MAREINRLSVASVRATKTPGLHPDGAGLYLQVSDSGTKSWLYRFALNGRERQMGLGSVNDVSLADARIEAQKCRALRRDHIDPIEARNAARAAVKLATAPLVTFRQATEQYLAAKESGWRSAKYRRDWEAAMETYAFPVLGTLAVHSVDTQHVTRVLQPIWSLKPETAGRVRGGIESVLDYAKTMDARKGDNPARWRGHLQNLLPSLSRVRKIVHHEALPYREIGAFMPKVATVTGVAARALEFIILTAARTNEVAGMRLREIDWQEKIWTVPGERMKGGIAHRIPLTPQALAILKAATAGMTKPDAFVFPGWKGKLSDTAIRMVHKRLGYEITTHGFRSTFKDWASECTTFPDLISEMVLAHKVDDAVVAAYRRTELLQKRRQLLEAWANYCGQRRAAPNSKVVAIRSRA